MAEEPRRPGEGGPSERSDETSGPPAVEEPSPAPDAPPPRPARRPLVSPAALLRATGLLMLIAVSTGAALLLPPAGLAGDLPGDEALGTLSPRTFKANRAYTIPDPEATEALRAEAARAVRPVWDFDPGAGEEAASRIAQAFPYMREAVEAELAAARAARRPRARKEPAEEDLVQAAQAHATEFMRLLQAWVDDGELRALATERFSPAVEEAAEALARRALGEEIVVSRELLQPVGAGGGIALRPTGPQRGRGERETRDVSQIADVASVRAELARLGEAVPAGRYAAALPPEAPASVRQAAAALVSLLVSPTLVYNALETEQRRRIAAAAVKPVVLQYVRGERIIGDGERIEKRHVVVFRSIRERARTLDIVQVRAGAGLFTALLVAAIFGLARRTVTRFRPSKRDLVFLSVALLGNLALLRAFFAASELLRDRLPVLTAEVTPLLLPLAAGTMLVRMLRPGPVAMVFALGFGPLAGMQLGGATPALVAMVGCVTAASRMSARSGPRALPAAAIEAGVTSALAAATLALFDGRILEPAAWLQAAAAFVGAAVLSPVSAALASPVLEAVFAYASEARLARLANLNNPVLKELIIKAPGTYHHSLLTAALAEAAARAIGAHPQLTRVGAYYHDLGKSQAPLMFGENQRTENRLEKLPPLAAAGYLRRHVQDGVDMGRAAKLPGAVLAFIEQHHGTRETGTFYQRAVEQAARDGAPAPAPEDFHYPGPRPRTREVALVMLADAVEAASRSQPDATPERLRALVPRVAETLVLDGQLDECDLTMAELRRAVGALQDALVEVHGLSPVEVLPRARPPSPGGGGPGLRKDELRLVR